ncbi:hypothetical protein BY996DRAFT_6512605 [Phakopsora pachyrhizi]|nr:hypothetical protein BY996DRAFT_6512605 [Phakopsora pachyrhizi]
MSILTDVNINSNSENHNRSRSKDSSNLNRLSDLERPESLNLKLDLDPGESGDSAAME